METKSGNYQNTESQQNQFNHASYLNLIFSNHPQQSPENYFPLQKSKQDAPNNYNQKLPFPKDTLPSSVIDLTPGSSSSGAPRFLPPPLRRRPRRRFGISEFDDCVESLQSNDFQQNPETKQAQVLKAAKSLFSKRTRTLYHWMYPNAPKQQLKAAVTDSWETLAVQEKEFYISQVLGRFGFPQCNLMVNPQLGGIRGIPQLPPLSPPNDETNTAVSSILMSDANAANSGSSYVSQLAAAAAAASSVQPPRQKRRLGRPPGSKNKKMKTTEQADYCGEQQEVQEGQEEFQDDPELSRELQQFKWALHKIKF